MPTRSRSASSQTWTALCDALHEWSPVEFERDPDPQPAGHVGEHLEPVRHDGKRFNRGRRRTIGAHDDCAAAQRVDQGHVGNLNLQIGSLRFRRREAFERSLESADCTHAGPVQKCKGFIDVMSGGKSQCLRSGRLNST